MPYTLITDADLAALVAEDGRMIRSAPEGTRRYSVTGFDATDTWHGYTVHAPNQTEARRLVREYAARIQSNPLHHVTATR